MSPRRHSLFPERFLRAGCIRRCSRIEQLGNLSSASRPPFVSRLTGCPRLRPEQFPFQLFLLRPAPPTPASSLRLRVVRPSSAQLTLTFLELVGAVFCDVDRAGRIVRLFSAIAAGDPLAKSTSKALGGELVSRGGGPNFSTPRTRRSMPSWIRASSFPCPLWC